MLLGLAGLQGCATVTQLPAFSYQLPDNRETDVAQVIATLPAERDASSEPRLVVSIHEENVVAGLALDGTEQWRAEVAAMTRPELHGDLVITSDREGLVALDAASGRVLWRTPIEGLAYVGSSRSGSTLVFVASVGAGGGATRVGRIRAVEARSGRDLWQHEIAGTLGHPQARGPWVFVPWDRQNIAILDLATGIEKARLRSTDDVIAWVRDLPSGVYYGGHGLYRFDARSASGTKSGSTYHAPLLPEAPREPLVADDGFFPTPGTRSARGRIRLYATPTPAGEELGLAGDRFYFVYYRYVFGYDAERNLRWARMLDQDVIAADALDSGLFVVGENGTLRLLSPETGNDVWTGGSERALASAGLDVRGFAPQGDGGEARDLATSLAEIAGDPDNRLVPARAFAIQKLGALEAPEVSSVLLDLYAQRSVPSALRETINEVLRQRTTGTEHLLAALQQRYDYLDERPAPPLELIVPALLEQRKTESVASLVAHMLDHETPIGVLPLVVRAIVELGDASVVPALQSFLVLYHADSTFAGQGDALAVAAEGIYRHGGDEGRAMLTA
ncbi:MAG: PQQ-binding-like beta-propeller repeat protein, partial [Sandaracinus sp.]|nr:PQQ-binding-like beta-propeller repeat protein [Sandaracinus sp.]